VQNCKLNKFIIIMAIVPLKHDSAIFLPLKRLRETPLLDDLRTLAPALSPSSSACRNPADLHRCPRDVQAMRGRRSASLFGPLSHPQGRSAPERPRASGSPLLGLPPLRQIFLGQRRSGRLGLQHDAHNSPAATFFDRLNAVDAARDLLAVAVQRVAAP